MSIYQELFFAYFIGNLLAFSVFVVGLFSGDIDIFWRRLTILGKIIAVIFSPFTIFGCAFVFIGVRILGLIVGLKN